MSRYTWLKPMHVQALMGVCYSAATRLMKKCWGQVNSCEYMRVTCGELCDYIESVGDRIPPLLVALAADEREYPLWLEALVIEQRECAKFGAKYQPKARVARTYKEAREIMDAMPELEARGYLEEEGLPPEMMMQDRFEWFDREDQDG